MTKPIVMKPGVIYRPRKPFQLSTLYKLVNFCQENHLRFGQALAIALDYDEEPLEAPDLFLIENDELEAKINNFIGL